MAVPAPFDDELYEARLADFHCRARRANTDSSARVNKRLTQLRADHTGPLSRMGARTLGDMAIVEPGCEIWARTGVNGSMRVGDDDADGDGVQARGGVVLEVTDNVDYDRETGEIAHRRSFRVFDYAAPSRQAYTTLTETQVDPSRFDGPNPSRLAGLVRRWCRQVGERNGILTSADAQLVVDAARLTAVLMQRTP